MKKVQKEDLKDGSWTIDVCVLGNIDDYFENTSIEDIQEELIVFLLEWEKTYNEE